MYTHNQNPIAMEAENPAASLYSGISENLQNRQNRRRRLYYTRHILAMTIILKIVIQWVGKFENFLP